jgi:phosphoribosyl-AMP cyclohydrolase
MTFKEWYEQNHKNTDFKFDATETYTYKMMEKVWEAGKQEGALEVLQELGQDFDNDDL